METQPRCNLTSSSNLDINESYFLMWTLGTREKQKLDAFQDISSFSVPGRCFFPPTSPLCAESDAARGKLTGLSLRGGSGGGGAQVSQAQGSGDQRGPFFLAVWAKRVQFSAPHQPQRAPDTRGYPSLSSYPD